MKKRIQISENDYQAALEESRNAPRNPWQLSAVLYDSVRNRIVMSFSQGVEFVLPVEFIEEFSKAKKKDLQKIYLTPSGETIVIDEVDAHISTKSLIEAVFSSLPPKLISSKFASRGGARTSAAKKVTSAENGRKGGRPKKHVGKEKELAIA